MKDDGLAFDFALAAFALGLNAIDALERSGALMPHNARACARALEDLHLRLEQHDLDQDRLFAELQDIRSLADRLHRRS